MRNVVVFSSDVRSSSSLSSYIAAGRFGQLSSFCQRKHGPMHQWLLPTMTSTVNPLEASSVGLRFVSTYFHWVGEDCSLIADTRFARLLLAEVLED